MEEGKKKIVIPFADINPEPFIIVARTWEEFGKEAKDFIKDMNVEALRKLTESFIRYGTVGDADRERLRRLLAFVYQEDFANKSPEEMISLLRQAYKKEREWSNSLLLEPEQKIKQYKGMSAPEIVRVKTRQERQLGKSMSNTLSPSSYNYLKLKTKRAEGLIKFIQKEVTRESNEEKVIVFEVRHPSDKCEMLIDFLFDKLAKKDDAILIKEKPKETDIIMYEQFEKAVEKPEEYLNAFGLIKFTAGEFRKKLGLRITDKEICKTVSDLENTKIVLRGVKIWYDSSESDRTKKYKKITHTERIVYSATIEETGKLAPRTKNPQHKFIVKIGSGWSLLFHNDIINKRYSCLPKKFYQASKGARALGRYLSCWSETTLKIGQISEILGYEEQTGNLTRRKHLIEGILDELKELRIIKKWKRVRKKGRETIGKETAWNIKTTTQKWINL